MLSCSRFLKPPTLLTALGLAALSFLASPHASAQVAVLTQNNDNARTGANLSETVLTPASVGGGNFGKLFTITGLGANVNGQALYVPGVTVMGTPHNVLYAYTSNNADHSPCGLNAFDADTGAPLWHTALPASATYTTATPVIDQAAGTMYVLTKTDNDDTGATFLRAFDIATGTEKPGSPVQVQASAPGTGDGSVNGVVSFDGPASGGRFHANDRAALLLLSGVVYTSFAHNSDSPPYHGWIIGYHYDGAHFTRTAVFCTTPNGGDGGIWMAGKGLTADTSGSLYCSVGNGTFDANTKGITPGTDYGMCYLKLRASDLSVVDWFAPNDELGLSNSDLDLGNSGLVGIPGTSRLFGGATKFGTGFLLDSSALGGFTANGPDKVLLRLDKLTGNDSVGQNPISWDAGAATKYVYLWAGGSNLEQFRYIPGPNTPDTNGTFSPAGIYKQTSGLTAGGSLAVTASGSNGGILWAVGNDNVVRAFDATDVTQAPFWTSALNASRDALGSVGHFQFPTVVNGKVYVPTGSHTIAVYGLLASASVPTIANASFELPSVGTGGYQYNPSGAGWTFAGHSGIQSNGSAWGAANAPDGTQTAFLQGYNGGANLGAFSQSVTFPSPGNFAVTFQAARRRGQIQPVQVSVDGVAVGSPITPVGSTFRAYTTASFSVGAGAHVITLSATATAGDNSTLLDQVALTQVAPSVSLVNASFELPSVGTGGYQYNPSGAGWTFAGRSGIQSNGSAWGAANAPDGTQTAFLQGYNGGGAPGSLSQSVSPGAGTYTLTFQAARRQGQIQPLQVSVDGVAVGSPITPADSSFASVTSAPFTLSAGAHTVTLAATDSSGDNSTLVDQVSVMSK